MSIRTHRVYVVTCDWPDCEIDTETLGGGCAQERALALRYWEDRGGIRVHPDPAVAPEHFCPEHAVEVCKTCGVTREQPSTPPGLVLILSDEDGWHYCAEHIGPEQAVTR